MEENANISWKRVWSNIGVKELTSMERSVYYLVVNGKIPHAQLLHRQNRVASPYCNQCPNTEEDLEHKLAGCPRISALWNHLLSRLETNIGRRMTFISLKIPELKNMNRRCRYQALKAFITYVNFILDANDQKTVEALNFVLNCVFV